MASRAPKITVLPETNVDPAPLCLAVGLAMVLNAVLLTGELPEAPVAIGVMSAGAVEVPFWYRT